MKKLLVALVGCLVVVVLLVSIYMNERNRLKRAFDAITIGTPQSEVEARLGNGKKVATGPGKVVDGTVVPVVEGDDIYKWEAGDVYLLIGFRNGKVFGKYFWEPDL
jgi:hypothetical protein